MRRVTIVNLETLCWIARLGSFTAAANRLHTTQPAISKRIKDLESSLGVSLFYRQGRRMELTIQGRDLVQRAQPLLGQLDDIAVFQDNPSAATGVIRMGVGEIVAVTWFPSLMARLKRLMPNVHYEVEVDLTVNMRHRLEVGLMDVAILAGPIESTQLTAHSIGSIGVQWVVSPNLVVGLDAGHARDTRRLLASQPVWCVARPSHMHPMALDTLRHHGITRKTVSTCDSVQGLVELVTQGAGIGLLPLPMVTDRLADGRLSLLSPALAPQRFDFVIAHHRDQEQAIIQRIVQEAIAASDFSQMAAIPG